MHSVKYNYAQNEVLIIIEIFYGKIQVWCIYQEVVISITLWSKIGIQTDRRTDKSLQNIFPNVTCK